MVGMPPQRRRQAAERGRPVAVEVQDVDLLPIDDPQQRRERQRVELRPLQVGDVDAEGVERFLRQVLLAQADERDVEARRGRSAGSSS